MTAINKDNICLTAAKVYVAPLDGSVPEVLADGSNQETVAAACKALLLTTAVRMASVIDTKLIVGKGKAITVEADDTKKVLNATVREVKISGSFYESKNVDAIEAFLGVKRTDVPGATSGGIFATFNGLVAGLITNVLITADTVGIIGNSVKLEFNGILTIAQTITAWNAAHASNHVTCTTGDASQVPTEYQEMVLTGGVATGTPANARTIFGGKIVAEEIPDCIVILEGINEAGKQEMVYLIDSAFTSDFVLSFTDYVRAGSPEASPFEFTVNSNGGYLVDREVTA